MKCVNAICLKNVNTAADVLYCPVCQRDGTANEINPARFPNIRDDMPIEQVLESHPGIAVRFQPNPAQAAQMAAPDEQPKAADELPKTGSEPETQTAPEVDSAPAETTSVPEEQSHHDDQQAAPDSSVEQ